MMMPSARSLAVAALLFAGQAGAQGLDGPVAAPARSVDDPGALELARALGIEGLVPGRPGGGAPRGLPGCPDPIGDMASCHTAMLTAEAPLSNVGANRYRVMENVVPAASSPSRLCWVGRYAGRQSQAVMNESFRVRVFAENLGAPDIGNGPIFERTFRQSGTAGIDRLELSCLDGQSCPGTANPPSGGHHVYSVDVGGGLPMTAGGCYWVEIACVGSAAAGRNWGWASSFAGIDGLHLQGVGGAYACTNPRAGDLSLCLSGGVNAAGLSCSLPVPPPVCNFDDGNGNPPDGNAFGAAASWPGSQLSPGFFPVQYAETVRVASAASVTGLCFWGNWSGRTDSGQTVPVSPPEDPGFRIAYYVDAAGVPGTPLPMAEFHVGVTPGVSMVWNCESVVSVEHPAVELEGGACYWLSIGRVQSQQGAGQPVAPLWHWQYTSLGTADGTLAVRRADVTRAWGHTGCETCPPNGLAFVLSAGPAAATECAPQPADCNLNGIVDSDEIALNPRLDCFYEGPDGVLDVCQCIADWNGGLYVNSNDISAFLNSWLASVAAGDARADVDCSGSTDSSDISAFLTRWIQAVTYGEHGLGC